MNAHVALPIVVEARPLVEQLVSVAGTTKGKFLVGSYGEGITATVLHVPNGPDAVIGLLKALGELSSIPGANVYIEPALRPLNTPEGQRGLLRDVVGVCAIVLDFDAHEKGPIDWRVRLPADLAPSLVVETSPGNFQLWFFFTRPYSVAEVQPVAAALVNDTGCDPISKDVAHMWRMPGSLNVPSAKKIAEGRSPEPFKARTVEDNLWCSYSLNDIRALILAKDATAFDRATPAVASDASFDWSQRKSPDKPTKPVDDAKIERALNKEGDRSALAFRHFERLRKSNYSAGEIVETSLKFPTTAVMSHYGDGEIEEDRLRADVKRAFTKLNPANDLNQFEQFANVYTVTDNDIVAQEAPPLRTIEVVGGLLPQNVDDAEQAMIDQSVGVFQRGSLLMQPALIPVKVRDGSRIDDHVLAEVRIASLIEHMTSTAAFVRFDKRDEQWRRIDCPRPVAETYLARAGQWKLRPLFGQINAPTLRPDGSLLDKPGYDAATGLIYDPHGVEFPPIPAKPTRDDALKALAVFDELIGEFPFGSRAARSVALAAILTACVRRTLPTAPLFGIDGTGAGSGKGLLADTIAVVGSGRPAAPIAGAETEELDKHIASVLIRGDGAICLDNLNNPLESSKLCSILTQETQSIRYLGQSRAVTLPTNALFLATGNGLSYAGDMWRRGLICLIDPAVERPSERVFEFSPVERAKEHRAKYVAAALTVLRAFQVAGRPKQGGKVMGSFEVWTATIRDALLWLGEADPAETCQPPASDPEREQLAALVLGWRTVIGEDRGVTIKEAIDIAQEAAGGPVTGERTAPTRHPELLDAFLAIATAPGRDGGRIDAKRLGMWIGKRRGLVIQDLRLWPEGMTDGAIRWRLSLAKGRAS